MERSMTEIFLPLLILMVECFHTSSQATQDLKFQIMEQEPEFLGIINNVTYPAGREAVLACLVRNLGKYKVGWLRASDQTVLALQGRIVTNNARISVIQEDMYTWKLRIKQLKESDKGCYMCQINTSPMKKQTGCIDVQIPPDIINEESSTDFAVQEGEDATLTCKATGNPIPRIIWKREDGEMILIRKPIGGSREFVKVELYNGTSLHLSRLERRQMGVYLCIASNDVPPAVSKRIFLSVHFVPLVHAPSQLLGAPFGSNVQLECQIEASPTPVSYWMKGAKIPSSILNTSGLSKGFNRNGGNGSELGQNRPEMLLDGPKYGITEQRNGYKGVMKLIIRSFSISDVGTYHCVSTNSLGRAEGTLRLYEIKLLSGEMLPNNDQFGIMEGLAEATRKRNNSNSLRHHEQFLTVYFLVWSIYQQIIIVLFSISR